MSKQGYTGRIYWLRYHPVLSTRELSGQDTAVAELVLSADKSSCTCLGFRIGGDTCLNPSPSPTAALWSGWQFHCISGSVTLNPFAFLPSLWSTQRPVYSGLNLNQTAMPWLPKHVLRTERFKCAMKGSLFRLEWVHTNVMFADSLRWKPRILTGYCVVNTWLYSKPGQFQNPYRYF